MDNLSIQELLLDSEFVLVALKEEDDPEWINYLQRHPANMDILVEARFILRASEKFPIKTLSPDRKQAIWEAIDSSIENERSHSDSFRGPFFSRIGFKWVAALIVFTIGLAIWNYQSPTAKLESNTIVTEVNNGNFVYSVSLPDGSSTLLKPGSHISYDSLTFGKNGSREVFLEGEAFFEVVTDSLHPFYVFTQGLTAKVLGTSFTVKAYATEKKIEVAVETGKVAVSPMTTAQKLSSSDFKVLYPHEKAVMNLENSELSLEKIDQPSLNETRIEEYIIDDLYVTEVLSKLEKDYEIKISYSKELLKDCKITAVFTEENLHKKLSLICKGIGASYSVIEGVIVIESTGCNS